MPLLSPYYESRSLLSGATQRARRSLIHCSGLREVHVSFLRAFDNFDRGTLNRRWCSLGIARGLHRTRTYTSHRGRARRGCSFLFGVAWLGNWRGAFTEQQGALVGASCYFVALID